MKNFTFISSIFLTLALGTVTQINAAAQEIQPAHDSQTAQAVTQTVAQDASLWLRRNVKDY